MPQRLCVCIKITLTGYNQAVKRTLRPGKDYCTDNEPVKGLGRSKM